VIQKNSQLYSSLAQQAALNYNDLPIEFLNNDQKVAFLYRHLPPHHLHHYLGLHYCNIVLIDNDLEDFVVDDHKGDQKTNKKIREKIFL